MVSILGIGLELLLQVCFITHGEHIRGSGELLVVQELGALYVHVWRWRVDQDDQKQNIVV